VPEEIICSGEFPNPNFDELAKSLFSPQSTQRSQNKYFYFQQVISVGFALSADNFQLCRIHQF